MKTRLLALSVMLSLANVLFAQNDITVIWEGYDVTNKGKAGSWTDDQFNNTFLSRLKTNDKNNQINIIPTYTRGGDEPEYRITGKIIMSDDFFTVDIQLYQKSTGITWMPGTNGTSAIYNITKTIEAQAEEMYNYIISIIQLNQSASAEATMRQFKEKYAYKIDLLTDGEQKNALDELEIIESKYGESQEITELRNRIEHLAVRSYLVRAEQNIDIALYGKVSNDSAQIFCDEAGRIMEQIKRIMANSQDTNFDRKIQEVEEKIEMFKQEYQKMVFTGGLEFFLDKPFSWLLVGPDLDFQEAYPDLLGFSLKYLIPFSSELMWYANLNYTGVNNHSKQKPEYLIDAALHQFFISVGMFGNIFINARLVPYWYFGLGYAHLIEYAKDGQNEATLNFPGELTEAGIGLRWHITPRFALDAKAQAGLRLFQSMLVDATFSIGAAYLFHGRERLTRK